ncbi:hypothetical protein [Embleya sp. NPDC059237]|uniref:hypothetical protein n=1 Tax=Embleya sp. NPDC059237 TaxID=3346784 RepID=UPI00367F5964
MPVYVPDDAFTSVVSGVHDTDFDEAWDQDADFEALARLHPTVLLADREPQDGPSSAITTRVRWTVPGTPRRPGPVWLSSVAVALGRLDADAHARIPEAHDRATARNAAGHITLLDDARLEHACAEDRPARTLALTTAGLDGFVLTDRGLYIVRAPSPTATVPLGYNFAACLAAKPFPEAATDAVVRTAFDAYRIAAHTVLADRVRTTCPCGLPLRRHLPTPEQVCVYLDIAAANTSQSATAPSPPGNTAPGHGRPGKPCEH